MASREGQGSWSNTSVRSIVPMSFIITATGRAPGSYTVYKIVFEEKVELPHGETVFNKYEIWKRFRDFQQLARQLEDIHTRTKSSEQFPGLVKPSYFERFKDIVIEERKQSIVALLKFASCQDHLQRCLSQFTEGALKVQSMPFQQTPVRPTSTFIDKPKDTVPLSRLLQESPHLAYARDIQTGTGDQTTASSENHTNPTSDLATPDCSQTDSNSSGLAATSGRVNKDDELADKSEQNQESTDDNSTIGADKGESEGDKNESGGNKDSEEEFGGDENGCGDAEENDSSESEGEVDATISSVAAMSNMSQDVLHSEPGGDMGSWWSDAMAVTDDLDSLVEQLEGRSGDTGVSTLSIDSNRKSLSRSPSPGQSSPGNKGPDYIAQAGKLITAALRSEDRQEYQEAFDLFKAGVDLLLNGVQTDSNKRRRDIVSRKTAEYLQHAESLYQKYLKSPQPESSSQLKAPAVKPHLLPDFKVVGSIDKVLLVESRHTGQRFVIKVLYKSLQAMASTGKGRGTTNRAPAHCKHMVKLLHHYETPNHRIFLLLEYVRRGRLVDFVAAKRAQWKRLHDAAIHPHPSSSLLKRSVSDDDDAMEKMLAELTNIDPPTSLPVTDSLTSAIESETSESPSEEDSLTALKRRLGEAVSATKSDLPNEDLETEGVSVNVQPPTPTTGPVPIPPSPARVSSNKVSSGSNLTQNSLDNSPLGSNPAQASPNKGSPTGSGRSTPKFSPGSLRGSPDTGAKVDEWVKRLEDNVREWAGGIILALEHLHSNGIICRDLNPANVLLSDSGKVLLTYFGKWDYVQSRIKFKLSQQFYTAPELMGLSEPTEACDWWSLGALLFEILTGKTLVSCHPCGLQSHLPLRIPVSLSPEAQSLLQQLLQVDPRERLGSGLAGAEELKSHVFFTGLNWKTL